MVVLKWDIGKLCTWTQKVWFDINIRNNLQCWLLPKTGGASRARLGSKWNYFTCCEIALLWLRRIGRRIYKISRKWWQIWYWRSLEIEIKWCSWEIYIAHQMEGTMTENKKNIILQNEIQNDTRSRFERWNRKRWHASMGRSLYQFFTDRCALVGLPDQSWRTLQI